MQEIYKSFKEIDSEIQSIKSFLNKSEYENLIDLFYSDRDCNTLALELIKSITSLSNGEIFYWCLMNGKFK